MIFSGDLAAAVMAGRKTVTRRICVANPRSPWFVDRTSMRVGKMVKVNPGRGVPNIGAIVITGARQESLGDLMALEGAELAAEVRREGFESLDAFLDAWRDINGDEACAPTMLVWRIAFRVAP